MKTVKLKFHNRFGKLDRTIISKIIDTTIIEFLGTLIVNDMDIVESSYCVAIGRSSNTYSDTVIRINAKRISNNAIKWLRYLFNLYVVRNQNQAIEQLNWDKSVQQEAELLKKLSASL